MDHLYSNWLEHWPVWLVSVVLVVAAIIDGRQLRVPNWLTFPMIVSGWIFGAVTGGWAGFGESLLGTAVGLALLMPAYAIGGMGAGDVKLLAGVGAWVGATTTFYAFCVSAVVTFEVVAPSRTPTRAPSRAAFVITCWTMTIRPYSIIPNTSRKNTGATIANSTAAAPHRFLRQDRQMSSNLKIPAPFRPAFTWQFARPR